MSGLAEMLAAHRVVLVETAGVTCLCDRHRPMTWTRYYDHLAAAVTAHLAEVLGADATREAAWRAIWQAEGDGFASIEWAQRYADAALAAVRVALGIEATT